MKDNILFDFVVIRAKDIMRTLGYLLVRKRLTKMYIPTGKKTKIFPNQLKTTQNIQPLTCQLL